MKKDESGIKSWDAADRPRERLLAMGRRNVTDAELLAILIHSGNGKESAVDLSKKILKSHGDSLVSVSQLSVKDLCKFKGVGEAKATAVIAALELGRRRKEDPSKKITQVRSSQDADAIIRPILVDLRQEEFWIILLNRAHGLIGTQIISQGGLAGTIVDPKVVFKVALEQNAAAIILAHNHPSGNVKPSTADIEVTKKLVAAGALLEINVLDHLIIVDHSFLSMADEGLM